MTRVSSALARAIVYAGLLLALAPLVNLGSADERSASDAPRAAGEAALPAAATSSASGASTGGTSSAAASAASGASASELNAALAAQLDPIVEATEFKHSHWGVLVVDQETCRTLYERNADKLFAPASVTKLFSTAAALDELGADFQFETPIYRRGEVDEAGTLEGDLVLAASGDPNLGGRIDTGGRITYRDVDHTYAGYASNAELTAADPLAGLDALAKQVYESGIREVMGDVLVDDRLFAATAGSGSGPSKVSPIVINDNVLDFTITPGELGKAATIDWRPRTSIYMVDAQVTTGPAGSKTTVSIDEPLSGTITVRGSIPAERKPLLLIHEVEQPASFARSLLIEALRRAGVRVEASPLTLNETEKLPRREALAMLKKAAVLKSPPLADELKLILKVSHNQHANMLPLILAAQAGKRTLIEGLRIERAALARAGVNVETISFGDGAGGERSDYVTPRATTELLCAMARRDDFSVYHDALPVLGVDGTLAAAVSAESPVRGKVRAKTGTLVWGDLLNERPLLQSKALAGYAETTSGRKVVFAVFVNLVPLNEPGDRERIGRVLGTICEKIYGAL